MPSGPNANKLLRFYMVEHCHVGDSNISPSVCRWDTAYADGRIEASKPYDVKQLRSILEIVSMLALMIPRNTECRTISYCTMISAPLTKSIFSILLSSLSTSRARISSMALCADILKLPLMR